jgi:hypothetical protein
MLRKYFLAGNSDYRALRQTSQYLKVLWPSQILPTQYEQAGVHTWLLELEVQLKPTEA